MLPAFGVGCTSSPVKAKTGGDTGSESDLDGDGDGNGTPCESLDGYSCLSRSDCAAINASLISRQDHCMEASESVGCRPAGSDCAEEETYAVDDTGQCWLFSCLNVPAHMSEIEGDEETIRVLCGIDPSVGLLPCFQVRDCDDDRIKTDEGCLTCQEAHDAAREAIDALLHDANKCEGDDECTVMLTDTRCQGTCQRALSIYSVDHVREELERISRRYCSDEKHDSLCGYVSPDCASATTRCSDRSCITEFVI